MAHPAHECTRAMELCVMTHREGTPMPLRQFRTQQTGQSLPIVVLFLGVLFGAIALAVDVGKVYALRNQTSTATSAAALAAAQVISAGLNSQIAGGPSTSSLQLAQSVTTSSCSSSSSSICSKAVQAADQVYTDNMRGSIPNNNLDTNPTVQIVVEPTSSSQSPGEIVVSVTTAQGSTSMPFGAVIGVPTAFVQQTAEAAVGLQSSVTFNALLPLMMPDQPKNKFDLYAAKPSPINSWLSQFIPNTTSLFLVRGSSNSPPQPPQGSPPGTITVSFHNLYGSGNNGILENSTDPNATVGQTLMVGGVTGSERWLPSVTVGQTVIMPVGYGYHSGASEDSFPVLGFITAKVDFVTSTTTGSKAGFVVTILDVSADTTATTLEGIGTSATPQPSTFGYELIPLSNSAS